MSLDRYNELSAAVADVIELIKALGLDDGFAEDLNPYVQEKFRELRAAAIQDEREP